MSLFPTEEDKAYQRGYAAGARAERERIFEALDKKALHEARTRSIKQGGLAFVEVQVWIESLRSTEAQHHSEVRR